MFPDALLAKAVFDRLILVEDESASAVASSDGYLRASDFTI